MKHIALSFAMADVYESGSRDINRRSTMYPLLLLFYMKQGYYGAMEDNERLTWRELKARIIARAWADPTFRQELLENGRSAIEKFLGQPLPAALNIGVLEEDSLTRFIVIPWTAEDIVTNVVHDETLDRLLSWILARADANARNGTFPFDAFHDSRQTREGADST